MNDAPRVSVLLAAHNAAPFVGQALESLLRQSCDDMEILALDDGSTDETASVMAAIRDPRVRTIRNERNLGLAATLNRGIDEARGEFIARMDADDLCEKERIEAQAAYMDAHPDIGLCGTWVRTFGRKRRRTWRYPRTPDAIRAEMIFHCPIAHPTVMFRRDLFQHHGLRYDDSLSSAQDYDLWSRAAFVTGLANLGRVLLQRREHTGQIGATRKDEQRQTRLGIQKRLLERLGVTLSTDELRLHDSYGARHTPEPLQELHGMAGILTRLAKTEQVMSFTSPTALAESLAQRWLQACHVRAHAGLPVWRLYRDAATSTRELAGTGLQSVALWMRCVVMGRGTG